MSEGSAFSLIESIVGHDVAAEIVSRLGGERVYIPRHHVVADRDTTICESFNGMLHNGSTCGNAYQAIATEYDLTPRRVQQIVTGA